MTGIDRCIVIDNGSTDGTLELLKRMAKLVRKLEVIEDPSPFRQSALVSSVVTQYTRRKLTTVIVFDSDECWGVSMKRIGKFFDARGVNVAQAEVVNFVQSHSVTVPSQLSWMKAYRRAVPVPGDVRVMVREHRIGFVEIDYPKKVLFRAQGDVVIQAGCHGVEFEGSATAAGPFACNHLPLRARSELVKRAYDYEKRRAPFRPNEQVSWQSLYFKEVADRQAIDSAWDANSYDACGFMRLPGRRAKAKVDFRLVRALSRAYAYGHFLGIH